MCTLESPHPYRRKGQTVELAIALLGLFVVFYFNWQVKEYSKALCPKGKMGCIGKYKRNLLTMKETKAILCLSQAFLLLQLAFVVSVPKLENYLSAKSIFWIYNSIYLIGFVVELIYHRKVIIPTFQLLSSLSVKPNKSNFFMTKPLNVLEPRRENVAIKLKSTKPKQNNRIVVSRKGKCVGKGTPSRSLPIVQ